MSDTKIIAASISVDVGAASRNVQDLTGKVAELKKELASTTAGSMDAAIASKKLSTAENELENATNKLAESSKAATGHFANIKNQMTALPGPLGAASAGVSKLGDTFKALLANPIVLLLAAIVAALALVFAAFKNAFEGGQKLEQVFDGIKAAAQALLDNLGKIGDAIVKLFHFDFSGAIAEIKGVGNAAEAAFGKMAKLTAERQRLDRMESKLDYEASVRSKDLAALREQAYDEDVPVAQRIESLEKLSAATKKAADDEKFQALQVKNEKIARLTVQEDGQRKNNKAIFAAMTEYNNKVKELSDEEFSIGKQLTKAKKQQASENREAAKADAEATKAQRQQLVEYTNKLLKLQQENDLFTIKDSYEKEQKLLDNKIADEKRTNELNFKDHKITRQQLIDLDKELDKKGALERKNLSDKHNEEVTKKEEDFEKAINAIKNKTKIDGIRDARELESVQLKITYADQLRQAMITYKDDAKKLADFKAALDENLKAEQDKLAEKNKKEDDKKKFDLAIQKLKNDPNSSFAQKIKNIDAEQVLVQQQFNNKYLSELDYNAKIKSLADERVATKKAEAEAHLAFDDSVGNSLTQLSEIVGKQTIAGRVLAVASIIAHQASAIGHIVMGVQEANIKAIAASPLTVGQPWVGINTAQGIIAGAASIAKSLL